MDYEKKYKEALEWMRGVYPTLTGAAREDAEHFFPELAESEDEKIRKIIRLALIASEDELSDFYKVHNTCRKECTDWLEKQKEQKPASSGSSEKPNNLLWSEEDEGVCKKQKEQPQVADASKMEPEVDFEKEIDKGIADYSFTKTIDSGGFKTTVIDYAKIARHFYELGLNARKED